MDFSKYPLEKIFHYVAGVIPGLITLLIFELISPGSFRWFLTLEFLGYRTKLSLILLTAFVIGNTLTAFISTVLAMIGGAVGAVIAQRTYKPPHTYDVAPWRDPRWRAVMKNHLGARAPDDTFLISQSSFDLRRKMTEILPEQARSVSLGQLDAERLKTEMDDGNWAGWYDHYHQLVIGKDERTFDSYVRKGLYFNLETAALCILVSAMFTATVRHWWYLVPACLWVLYLVLEIVGAVHRYTNKLLTLSEQIKYLSEADRNTGPSGAPEPPKVPSASALG